MASPLASEAAGEEGAPGRRPLPQPSSLTRAFWEQARQRTLVRPVCHRCGLSHFTPQVACPHCLSTDWSYAPSSGRGVVYSWTIVHRPPGPGFDPPYIIAIVDLDEGWSMLTNLVMPDGHEPRIGQPVAVGFQPEGDLLLPIFEPISDRRDSTL